MSITHTNTILIKTQKVIDNAVEAVAATRQTQTMLEGYVDYVNNKVDDIHNVDHQSHPDIRAVLEDMPSMMNDPIILEGPTSVVESGFAYTWKIGGSCVFPTLKVSKFTITPAGGDPIEHEFTPEEQNAHGAQASYDWTYTFTGPRNSETSFSVVVESDYGYVSKPTTVNLRISQHLEPDISAKVVTIPEIISYGKSGYKLSVTGITEPDEVDDPNETSENLRYDITAPTGITFDSTGTNTITACAQGVEYGFSVAANMVGPSDISFSFDVYNQNDVAYNKHATFTASTHLNGKPAGNMAHNLPQFLCANTTDFVMRVAGMTDPEGKELTYDVTSSHTGITFTPNKNIKLNDPVLVNAGSIAEGTNYTLTFTFKDPDGGSISKTISSHINKSPVVSGFTFDVPAKLKKGNSTIKFNGATDPEGEEITYEIENPHSAISFGLTRGIINNQNVVLTVGSDIDRTKDYPIKVYAVDKSGGKTLAQTITLIINKLPDANAFKTCFPTIVVPGKTISVVIDSTLAKDNDNDDLTFDIECANPDVDITYIKPLRAGSTVTLTPPTAAQLARGSKFVLDIKVDDGYEVDYDHFEIQQNKLPVLNTSGFTFPARFYGGTENKQTMKMGTYTEPDSGQTVSLEITSISSTLTAAKKTGITANSTVEITANKVSAKTTATVVVKAKDSLGEYSSASFTGTTEIYPIIYTVTPSFTSPANNTAFASGNNGKLVWSKYQAAIDTTTGEKGTVTDNIFLGAANLGTNREEKKLPIVATGPTNASYGMNATEATNYYKNTKMAGKVTIVGTGFQKIVIPETGTYNIQAIGAFGGASGPNTGMLMTTNMGGRPAIVKADFALTKNDILYVLVGQAGCSQAYDTTNTNWNKPQVAGSGGGATMVVRVTTSGTFTFAPTNEKVEVLLVAAGGAGRCAVSETAKTLNYVNAAGTTVCSSAANQYMHYLDDSTDRDASVHNAKLPNATSTAASGTYGGASIDKNATTGTNMLIANSANSSASTTNGGFGGGGKCSATNAGGGGGYNGGAGGAHASGGQSFVNTKGTNIKRKLVDLYEGLPVKNGRVVISSGANRRNQVPTSTSLTEADIARLNA